MNKGRIRKGAAAFLVAGCVFMAPCMGVLGGEVISEEKAKEIALSAAEVSAEEATFEKVEKGREQGVEVYEIGFWTAKREYDYDISMEEGQIVSESWELISPLAEGKELSEEEARQAALLQAGVEEKDALFVRVESDTEEGMEVYSFDFETETHQFECEVAKAGGVVLSAGSKWKEEALLRPEEKEKTLGEAKTGEEAALWVALEHAGLAQEEVTGLHCEKDRDNGREIYEVEFRQGGFEYSYEIDAESLSILEWEKEED